MRQSKHDPNLSTFDEAIHMHLTGRAFRANVNTMLNTPQNCCLCSQISGQRAGDLISSLLGEEEYTRRVAFESENFAIIPSLGPIAPGHTLVCPKKHVTSFARLANDFETESGLSDEWDALSRRLVVVLERLYGAPVHKFEHGSAADGTHVACTVEHAHFHFLPARVDVLSGLLQDAMWQPACTKVSSWQVVGEREYLYYESPNGVALIAVHEDRYQSQHMRRVFGLALGQGDHWNWRSNPRPELADRIYHEIANAMA